MVERDLAHTKVAAGPALRGARLQPPVVFAASPGAPGIHGRGRLGGHRRGPRAALPRLRAERAGRRAPRSPTTTRWPPTSRATPTSTAQPPDPFTSGRSAPRHGRRPPQRPPTWPTSRHDRSAVVGPASGWARPGDPGVLGLARGRSPAAAGSPAGKRGARAHAARQGLSQRHWRPKSWMRWRRSRSNRTPPTRTCTRPSSGCSGHLGPAVDAGRTRNDIQVQTAMRCN